MTLPTEPTELSTALLAGLAIQANQLTDAAEQLRATYRFSRALRAVIALGFLMLAGLSVVALQNHSNGAAVRKSVTAANNGVAAIRDCTTPGGVCYQRNQASTGKAVADIVSAVNTHTDVVFAVTIECSRTTHTAAAFSACLHAKGVR